MALKAKKLTGLDLICQYRPCHKGLEDCTFCYCPFYPCNDPQTGGSKIISKRTGQPVWSCENCIFPHKTRNAQEILSELVKLGKDFESISPNALNDLRAKILQKQGEKDAC
jgi:threonine-phosphate decarboxylase